MLTVSIAEPEFVSPVALCAVPTKCGCRVFPFAVATLMGCFLSALTRDNGGQRVHFDFFFIHHSFEAFGKKPAGILLGLKEKQVARAEITHFFMHRSKA